MMDARNAEAKEREGKLQAQAKEREGKLQAQVSASMEKLADVNARNAEMAVIYSVIHTLQLR